MYLRAALLLILLPLLCCHRNTKERKGGSKHDLPLHPRHLVPSNADTNPVGKQTKEHSTETDNMYSTTTDASLRENMIRTRRSTSGFRRDVIACKDEDGFEVSARVCDGFYNCANKLDEKDCHNRTCPVLTIQCDTVSCYDIENRCDGERLCEDNSDEENCDNIACPDYFFQCKSGQCILYVYECDDEFDCSDKSDELNCKPELRDTPYMYPNCTADDYFCPSALCMRRVMVCDSLFKDSFKKDGSLGYDHSDCIQFINEINCADYRCFDPDYSQCNSGHCIDRNLWCNVRLDCADGSDESSCANHICPDPTNFQCTTGQCIDQADWCNINSNCPDGSDENACKNNTCTSQDYEFQCKSGQCIASLFRCDNRLDCPDGSDENNCQNYTACPMLYYRCSPDECYPIEQHCDSQYGKDNECSPDWDYFFFCKLACPDGFFRCNNGQCVLYQLICNDKDDCIDKSDEETEMCKYVGTSWFCPQGYYRQCSEQCISRMFICEYMHSLDRESTYMALPKRYSVVPKSCSDKFTCENYTCIDQRAFQCGSGHCMEPDTRCNGLKECDDGSDESSCENHICLDPYTLLMGAIRPVFQCKSGHCIEGSRCDTVVQCPDGSDEIGCSSICSPSFFRQCNSGQCYRIENQCTGDNLCPDGTDEENCLNATCPNDYFRCKSGQCVAYFKRCDSDIDCFDYSDEENCPDMYCPDGYYRCRDGRCISLKTICDFSFWGSAELVVACKDEFNYVSCENYTCIYPEYRSHCKNGRCFTSATRCDGKFHCTDGSDEEDCDPGCISNCTTFNGECVHKEDICDFIPDCIDLSDESNCNNMIAACSSSEYQCKTGHCVSVKRALCKGLFDFQSDPSQPQYHQCPIFRDDEKHCPFLKCPSNYLRTPNGNCGEPITSNISCSTSKISYRCPYNCSNNIYYLQCCNCQCIHRVSICDGINDCPDGADERNCGIPDCRDDQFYCGTINCFPSELLCDGFAHCPDEHDETSCKRNKTDTFADNSDHSIDDQEQCFDPSICRTERQINLLYGYTDVNVDDNSICLLFCQYPCVCSNVGIMRCNQRVEDMPLNSTVNMLWPFKAPSKRTFARSDTDSFLFFTFDLMSEISITNALLTEVPTRLLSCAFNIHHLDLSNNGITNIAVGDFGHLYRLSVLDLSNNLISSIEDYSFKGIRVLHLRLNKNVISNFGIDLFSGMAADGTIETDEFKFCCLRPTYFPEQNCYPKTDQFSSCNDLMRNDILRVMLWIVGLLALIGNVGVLLFKIFADRESLKKNFGVMVINLAIADALMGVYLLSIASVDVMYRGIYVLKENEWRNSIGCKLLGALCTISSEASVLFICLITLDRYLITKYPFGQVRLSRFILITMCVCIWIIAVAIAATPFAIVSYFKGNYFSKSGVCIALPLTTESYDGWEYSFAINVCLNCILFLFVGIGQFLIYKEFRASQTQRIESTRRNNDMTIARRLMLIVISDFLCWIPIGVLGILALAGVKIPPDVYAWVTVFVLPINSALNPFLYTLISVFSNWRKNHSG